MYSGDLRKQEAELQYHFNNRPNLFFFSTFAIFAVIIVRLAILQFVEGSTSPARHGIESEGHSLFTNDSFPQEVHCNTRQ
ncbi:hypothetical protein ACE3MQ_17130 [Paenibacillus lentus]